MRRNLRNYATFLTLPLLFTDLLNVDPPLPWVPVDPTLLAAELTLAGVVPLSDSGPVELLSYWRSG